eukprot:657071-Heterocapsa_arctica.AAC.1
MGGEMMGGLSAPLAAAARAAAPPRAQTQMQMFDVTLFTALCATAQPRRGLDKSYLSAQGLEASYLDVKRA